MTLACLENHTMEGTEAITRVEVTIHKLEAIIRKEGITHKAEQEASIP